MSIDHHFCLSYQSYFLSCLPLQLKLLLIVDVDIRTQLYLNQLQFRISYHSMTAACGHSYNVTWLYHLLHIIHDGFSLTRYDYSHLIPVLVTVIVHTVAGIFIILFRSFFFRLKNYWKFTFLQEIPHKYGLFLNFILITLIEDSNLLHLEVSLRITNVFYDIP